MPVLWLTSQGLFGARASHPTPTPSSLCLYIFISSGSYDHEPLMLIYEISSAPRILKVLDLAACNATDTLCNSATPHDFNTDFTIGMHKIRCEITIEATWATKSKTESITSNIQLSRPSDNDMAKPLWEMTIFTTFLSITFFGNFINFSSNKQDEVNSSYLPRDRLGRGVENDD